MNKILVHCHVYYPHMWAELRKCIQNIAPYPFDLYVTLVEKHQDVINDVKCTFPSSKVEIVENRGYDIGPFIHVLNQINLDDYDYVIKLHTKRDLRILTSIGNGFSFTGNQWRNELLRFITNKRNFEKCITSLQNDKNLGCCASFKVIHPIKNYWGCDLPTRTKYNKYILHLANFNFVAGTMFIVKANLLKTIQKMDIKSDLFGKPDDNHSIQFAHIIERTLGEVIYANGNYIKDVFTPFISFRKSIIALNIIKRFFFQKKVTSSGHMIIKVIKIPVYHRRIDLISEKENA